MTKVKDFGIYGIPLVIAIGLGLYMAANYGRAVEDPSVKKTDIGSDEPAPAAKTLGKAVQTPQLTYRVYEDESRDIPLMSLVRMHLVASGHFTKESVMQLLDKVYREKIKGPFKWHPSDPQLDVFVYPDEARAKSGQGLWVGQLLVDAGKAPEYNIDENVLEDINAKPVIRFGLTKNQREKFFRRICRCEDKVPLTGHNQEAADCTYKEKSKFHLTNEQCDKIAAEGIKYKWASPPSTH